MKDPSKKEREQMGHAYALIEYACERTSWDNPPTLKEALKREKRHCGNLCHAQANVINCFLRGWDSPDKPANEVALLREGARDALLLGAHMRTNWPDVIDEAAETHLRRAVDLQEAMQRARFEEIRQEAL